jgi:hypothetical protein
MNKESEVLVMKKLIGLAAVAAAMVVSASAATITVQETCGSFADTLANTTDTTLGTIPGFSTPQAVNCAAPSTFLSAGETYVSEQLIFQQGFTSGSSSGPNTITGTFTISPAVASLDNDTLVTTAAIGATPQSTTDTWAVGTFTIPANIIDGGSTTLNGPVTVDVTESLTAGSIQSATGNVYELITYSTAAPEPMTFSLMGVGLLGIGLIGRRLRKQ